MSLQKGNVEVNGAIGQSPEPVITVEEFREQFTEEHRDALYTAVLQLEVVKLQLALSSEISEDEALRKAHDETRQAREALQLIFKLHPPPYEW